MTPETIGLDHEQRGDFQLRSIFTEAYDLVVAFMAADGNWLSQAHEHRAYDAMAQHYPDITGMRLFAVLGTIAGVRASGRQPVD